MNRLLGNAVLPFAFALFALAACGAPEEENTAVGESTAAVTKKPVACDAKHRCPAGDYCKPTVADSCGAGVCEAASKVCPDICSANCGCDGKEYCNACLAERAGTTIAHTGACPGDCATAADCTGALPDLCERCANGLNGCAHHECVAGKCTIAYCN